MSTAQNHRRRSHRSQYIRRSALGSFNRRARLYDSRSRYGGPGIPPILHLQRMRQKIMEARIKSGEGKDNAEN